MGWPCRVCLIGRWVYLTFIRICVYIPNTRSRSIVGVEERTAKATQGNPEPPTQLNLLIFDSYSVGDALYENTPCAEGALRC